MRYIAIVAALFATSAMAAPFLITDPLIPSATHCGYELNEGARVDVPVAVINTGSGTELVCRIDLGNLVRGTHIATLTTVVAGASRDESLPSTDFQIRAVRLSSTRWLWTGSEMVVCVTATAVCTWQ